jgi:hypothetical protein
LDILNAGVLEGITFTNLARPALVSLEVVSAAEAGAVLIVNHLSFF